MGEWVRRAGAKECFAIERSKPAKTGHSDWSHTGDVRLPSAKSAACQAETGELAIGDGDVELATHDHRIQHCAQRPELDLIVERLGHPGEEDPPDRAKSGRRRLTKPPLKHVAQGP